MAGLVDQYLLQLKTYLPAKQREDIAAELGESILSSVDERERELGRKLADEELVTLLKGFGHPLRVAGRYLPKQYLIGPGVFPLYWYALQAVIIIVAVIAAILGAVVLLTEAQPVLSFTQMLWNVFWFAVQAAAVVTLNFALIDYYGIHLGLLEDYDPRKGGAGVWGLRAAPLSPIPRADTIFEIATLGILFAWWVGWVDFVNMTGFGVAVQFSAAIEPFFWPVLVLCVADAARLGVDLVYAYRTLPRTILRLSFSIVWLILIVLLFRADGMIEAVPGSLADAAQIERAVTIMERIFRVTLFVLGTVTAATIGADLVRIARR
jgi:hypothetical protein